MYNGLNITWTIRDRHPVELLSQRNYHPNVPVRAKNLMASYINGTTMWDGIAPATRPPVLPRADLGRAVIQVARHGAVILARMDSDYLTIRNT